jgi:hypothetical protein
MYRGIRLRVRLIAGLIQLAALALVAVPTIAVVFFRPDDWTATLGAATWLTSMIFVVLVEVLRWGVRRRHHRTRMDRSVAEHDDREERTD